MDTFSSSTCCLSYFIYFSRPSGVYMVLEIKWMSTIFLYQFDKTCKLHYIDRILGSNGYVTCHVRYEMMAQRGHIKRQRSSLWLTLDSLSLWRCASYFYGCFFITEIGGSLPYLGNKRTSRRYRNKRVVLYVCARLLNEVALW